jgi:hypothetical protein
VGRIFSGHFFQIVSEIVASEFDIEDGDDGIASVPFSVEFLGRGIVIVLYMSE